MKPEELRIGDWVYHSGNYNQLMRVSLSSFDYAGFFTPVPLTSGWLGGFSNYRDGVYTWEHGPEFVSARQVPAGWDIEMFRHANDFTARIRYVHEMQHLIADCGIKLDINAPAKKDSNR